MKPQPHHYQKANKDIGKTTSEIIRFLGGSPSQNWFQWLLSAQPKGRCPSEFRWPTFWYRGRRRSGPQCLSQKIDTFRREVVIRFLWKTQNGSHRIYKEKKANEGWDTCAPAATRMFWNYVLYLLLWRLWFSCFMGNFARNEHLWGPRMVAQVPLDGQNVFKNLTNNSIEYWFATKCTWDKAIHFGHPALGKKNDVWNPCNTCNIFCRASNCLEKIPRHP